VFFFNRKFDVKIWLLWANITNKILKLTINLNYEIKGIKNLNLNSKILYASQHQSAWDTIMLPHIIGDCIIFHKKSLLFIPVFGWHLYKLGMIIIDRSKGTKNLKRIIFLTKKAISEKRSILIFPHGTRTQHNTKNEIQSGVVSLYKHLNIKVIPIKLNSGNYWGRKRFLKRPGKIIVEFLKPIKPGLKPGKFRKKLKNIL
jgi:1-acyl-sn-glycerol-3-phosphate acyltransferase